MKFTAMVMAVLAVGVSATPLQAATTGSALRATARSCTATAATANCDGTGPRQGIFANVYGGGIGVDGSADLTLAPGDFARGTVSYGVLDLPEIRGETSAAGNIRTNINIFGFKSLLYTGAAPALFTLTGDLHIVDSSTNPAGGALPGGAIYSSYVAIWDPGIIAGLLTPEQLFGTLFYAGCDTPGVLGVFNGGGSLPGGEASFAGTTSECTPGSLTLAPGQEVLAVAGLQLPVNRGGFADATATFVTRLGDNLDTAQQQILISNLVSGRSLVPEPGSWMMLIAGFGLIGAAQRRRTARAAI